MDHDFGKYFDTTSEYWQLLQELYKANKHHAKKIVKGRNLHHIFPRSFSKLEKKPVDNDKDNLISLSILDHFKAHYFIHMCTKKGYRRHTALPFFYMLKKSITKLSKNKLHKIVEIILE